MNSYSLEIEFLSTEARRCMDCSFLGLPRAKEIVDSDVFIMLSVLSSRYKTI